MGRNKNVISNAPKEFTALDLEISKVIPEDARDWNVYRPFGIICAATVCSNGTQHIWYGKLPDGGIADKMSRVDIATLVYYLTSEVSDGKTIVSWNGLSFDLAVLAEESGLHDECKEIALSHIDMMFHLFCEKGYPLSLDKAAKGMGLSGKSTDMNGALAPKLWAQGRREEVLNYVLHDTKMTLDLFEITTERKSLFWRSNKNNSMVLHLRKGWMNVRNALKLPLPDISWMTLPWPRTKFTAWMSAQKGATNQESSDIKQSDDTSQSSLFISTSPTPIKPVTFFNYAGNHEQIWNSIINQGITHSVLGKGVIQSISFYGNVTRSSTKVMFDHPIETEKNRRTSSVDIGLLAFADGTILGFDLSADLAVKLQEDIHRYEEEKKAREKWEEEMKKEIDRIKREGCRDEMVIENSDISSSSYGGIYDVGYEQNMSDYSDEQNEYEFERGQSDYIDEDNENEYYEN